MFTLEWFFIGVYSYSRKYMCNTLNSSLSEFRQLSVDIQDSYKMVGNTKEDAFRMEDD